MYICIYIYVTYTYTHTYCMKNTAIAASDCLGIWVCPSQCPIRQVVVVSSAAVTRANYHTEPCQFRAGRTGGWWWGGGGVRTEWQSDSCREKCRRRRRRRTAWQQRLYSPPSCSHAVDGSEHLSLGWNTSWIPRFWFGGAFLISSNSQTGTLLVLQ